MVLDLTRELDEWQTYDSPREARAAMRRQYEEDRWLGQKFYPVLIVDRAKAFVEQYGDRCWEADVLPAAVIEHAIEDDIRSWLDAKRWKQRNAEIERARTLL